MNEIEQNGITYRLDDQNSSATVLTWKLNAYEIPKNITHENKEYKIIRLLGYNTRSNSGYHTNYTKIKSITFANDSLISTLDNFCFNYATTLETITIPSSVKTIGNYAFRECYALHEVIFQDKSMLQKINYGAFQNTKIQEITFPPNLIEIENCSFQNCSNLKTVKILENSIFQKIGACSFSGCYNLQTIEISNNSRIDSIGDSAFDSTNIKTFKIPEHLDQKYNCSFLINTTHLVSIEVSPFNKHYLFFDEKMLLYKENEKSSTFDTIVFARRDIDSIIIPPYIKRIGSYAFYKCSNLRSIKFSNNSELEIIDDYAFHSTSLTEIEIPIHTHTIGNWVFYECKNLQTVKFADNSELVKIGRYCFYQSALTQINIPIHTRYIEEYAFKNCNNLCSITLHDNSELISIGSYGFESSGLEQIKITSKVQKIGNYAFSNCQKLQTVEFSNNSCYTFIENYTFRSTPIKEIKLPDSVRKIEDYAFDNCRSLKTIEFTDNSELNFIGNCAFQSAQIEKISFPSKIQQIGEYAFNACSNLKTVEFKEKSELYIIKRYAFQSCTFDKITIPANTRIIEDYAFNYCSYLTKVDFQPNSQLISIGEYILQNTRVNEIVLPPTLECIKDRCFKGNSYLSKIVFSKESKHFAIVDNCMILYKAHDDNPDFDTLISVSQNTESLIVPPSVKEISRYALDGCNRLKRFEISKGSNLKYIHQDVFKDKNLEEIIVPFCLINIQSYINKYENVTRIGIIDDEVRLNKYAFFDVPNVKQVSLQYAKKIYVDNSCPKLEVFTCFDVPVYGSYSNTIQIREIEDELFKKNRFPSMNDVITYYHEKEKKRK